MKTLYLDCQMGAAGDMIMAALIELIDDPDIFMRQLNDIGLPGLHVWKESAKRCGYTGTQVHVEESQQHHHSTLAEIWTMIDRLSVSEQVKRDAKAVYMIIAEAESFVHGQPVEMVHFHEVGAPDAIADVVGTCLLMENLRVDQVVLSPIHVGSGTVKCAHGVMTVPTPATAKILEGMPIYSRDVQGELCTPTGAALLRYFGQRFGPMPEMNAYKSGRGMGTKVFPGQVNGLAVMLGETE